MDRLRSSQTVDHSGFALGHPIGTEPSGDVTVWSPRRRALIPMSGWVILNGQGIVASPAWFMILIVHASTILRNLTRTTPADEQLPDAERRRQNDLEGPR
jgi:hypothetical protein